MKHDIKPGRCYHRRARRTMRNLATAVEDFRRYGREIAVVRYKGNRRRVSTYGDIARLAGRFAALLAHKDVGGGDRVLLWGENSAEWIAAFHGCILRGALVVPLDAYGSADFANRIAADVQAKFAVGDALLMRQLRSGDSHSYPRITFEDWPALLPKEEAVPVSAIEPDTPLQILFTSGTTGDPKGIVHTHGNVLASIAPIEKGARGYLKYEKFVHPLRFLHTLPLSHVFGQTMGLWIPPIFRAEVHLESRLAAPRLIETIKRERISVLAAVPRVLALLKTHLETSDPGLSERIASSQGIRAGTRWWRFRAVHRTFGLKFWAFISGGGALPAAVEQFWNGLGFVLVQGYGMTETAALITLNHPFHVARGTIGKPLPGREVKIGPDGEVLVRGPMVSNATWSGGALRKHDDQWLATGDLAEQQDTGELRFLGRKSEVIVTGTGVNIHPEDLEAAVEEQPGVSACAVVPMDTPAGPEPCAVLAMRGDNGQAATAVERANASLPEFQRLRRWVLWPEPDLPRTSTGKVRRQPVAAWLAGIQAAATSGSSEAAGSFVPSSDWLLALIAQITGEIPHGAGDELRLTEDLHLDSLGRVQLAFAIEDKLGMAPESGLLENVQSLGQLRALVSGTPENASPESLPPAADPALSPALGHHDASPADGSVLHEDTASAVPQMVQNNDRTLPRPRRWNPIYPQWPWSAPFRWLRAVFIEAILRPLVWLLANPRVFLPSELETANAEPMLIVANHVTAFDGPLIQYALPGAMRRHIAAAMSGEMLEDFRHFRNPERGDGGFFPFGPLAWFLLTALFNVFPLPRLRDFQRSFAHAGQALDHGFHVLVFPEGTRSAAGQLARFRPGIGLLVKQSDAPVLPIAVHGLGELKARGRGWVRSGTIEVRVGEPIRFALDATEADITERLHAEVVKLLNG
jgi:long-chain acyl-CoA synthetase